MKKAVSNIFSLRFLLQQASGIYSRTQSICQRGRWLMCAIAGLFLLMPTLLEAQTFTKRIQQPHKNGGKLTIVEKSKIDSIVDNTTTTVTPSKVAEKKEFKAEAKDTITQKTELSENDKTEDNSTTKGAITVYRIQIYTGGNTRQSKARAEEIKQQCKAAFPELNVYVRFISPHWVCRVGNFRSKQTAQRYVQQIKSKRISYETRILTSTIYKK